MTPAPFFTRRRLLKTVFCSSAALSLNLRPQAVKAAAGEDLHLMMIGDFGSMEPSQEAVANGMQKYLKASGAKPEWLLLVGDNFYKPMPGGLKSERWKTGFEDMYPASVFPGPCPAVLGNHDYHDNKGGEQVQLAYAKQGGTRWTMPAKWYRMELGKLVTFLFIDTNLRSISGGTITAKDGTKIERNSLTADEEAAQWTWLKDELAKPRAPFTVVVGHHPVYSNGQHGDSKELVKTLAPMLQQAGVHLYLCGHDHDLQHLELEGLKTSYVLSGGGGARVRDLTNKDRKMPFGTAVYGFSHLEVNAERIIVRHMDANAKQIHAFEKKLDHSWAAV
jgi:hypothetical protein